MKKIILLIVAGLMLMTTVPAFAAPSENANTRALQAQSIKICREMMKGKVKVGDITNDQLKTCIEMMKTFPCSDMVN
ncbi:MAG: hypothetical protein ACOY46_18380 [Bacillota bacterium]